MKTDILFYNVFMQNRLYLITLYTTTSLLVADDEDRTMTMIHVK